MKKEFRQCFARVFLSCKRPLRYLMYNRCACEFTRTYNPLKLPAKKISITVKSQTPAFNFVKKKLIMRYWFGKVRVGTIQ